jgi:hypothetical protein
MEINDDLLTAIAEIIDYLGDPQNALAVWIAASGLLAGAHIAAPIIAL